jgi:hypothetical protein
VAIVPYDGISAPGQGQHPRGPARELASLISDHEDAHVKAIKAVLKSKAVKKPKFDFGNAVTDLPTFLKTVFTLENTGVHAYLVQAGKIKTPAILKAAASIVTVEARHSAAIALIQDQNRIKGPGGITPQGDRGGPPTGRPDCSQRDDERDASSVTLPSRARLGRRPPRERTERCSLR